MSDDPFSLSVSTHSNLRSISSGSESVGPNDSRRPHWLKKSWRVDTLTLPPPTIDCIHLMYLVFGRGLVFGLQTCVSADFSRVDRTLQPDLFAVTKH